MITSRGSGVLCDTYRFGLTSPLAFSLFSRGSIGNQTVSLDLLHLNSIKTFMSLYLSVKDYQENYRLILESVSLFVIQEATISFL